jgi:proline iminopeptidase
VLSALLWLLAALVLAAVVMWVATRGDYPVRATVVDDPTLPALTVLGLRLHGRILGNSGPLVIVLHGGPGGDHRSLLPLEALVTQGFRVLLYDQRGAGLSERVADTALTLQGHLDEVSALADRFSPDDPVIIIGHSWGAMLGSAWIGRNPGRAAGAVLIEPGFLSAAQSDAFARRMKRLLLTPTMLGRAVVTGFRARHVRGPDADAARDYLVGTMVGAFANHPDTPYHCPGEAFDSPSWRYGARAGQAVQAQASREDLDSLGRPGAYGGPVLLMAGACDTWIGPDLQRENLMRFPAGTLAVIEGAGHDVIDDQPDAALTRIAAFLAPLRQRDSD